MSQGFKDMNSLLSGQKSIQDLTEKYSNQLRMYSSGFATGNPPSEIAVIGFSFALVNSQIDNLSVKVDILAHIGNNFEKQFHNQMGYLTSDMLDSSELESSIDKKNKMLKVFGKRSVRPKPLFWFRSHTKTQIGLYLWSIP